MEVHPPHHPLHSWNDFWIRLGSITGQDATAVSEVTTAGSVAMPGRERDVVAMKR
jgi:hypothetical protein